MDDNQVAVVEEALTRFLDAQARGERPDIDEFIEQYPQFEAQIRRRIQDLQEIDALFDSLIHTDESDFDGTVTTRDLVGQKLGAFEIEKVIGRGGMGVVYLARDTKLDRLVAIKSVPPELQANSAAQTRFRREARLLASLSHPNIAVIYDIIEQEALGYLILEYIPGETLGGRIAGEPLKLAEALSIGQQVAEAVSAAHEKDVVHRDLKPGNIKITPDNRVKVLDFGLAKATRHEGISAETTASHSGRLVGTPAYMSPEQIRGRPTDHRTDIWSFGCILYEMLTGQRPFEGDTVSDTIARTLERDPDWQLLPQQIPQNIRVLIRRCLEKDPEKRLQHMGDAAIEIREAVSLTATKVRPLQAVMIVGAAIVIAASALVVRHFLPGQPDTTAKEKMLVVLPFENLGPVEDEYFVSGITSAVTARLASIAGLGVISRQSALQYKDRNKSTQQIGEELGVDYILEGTVQRERPSDPTSQLRIIPQLVRVSDDRHIWAEPYDSSMTRVFQVQSDLAERVAQALDITLLEPERQALQSRPTENLEAYDYYLRGNTYMERGCFREENARIAAQMYQKAVDLDPQFTLAYARLATAHLSMYWYRHDRSDSRLAVAKEAIDKLLQLDSDLPETHRALGIYHYWGHLKYDRALEELSVAIKSSPNDAMLFIFTGAVQRRMGRFDQALVEFRKAYRLNPRSSLPALLLAETYALLRNYPKALRHCDRAIALSPDLSKPYGRKIKVLLSRYGTTDKAHQVVSQALDVGTVEADLFAFHRVRLEIFDGNYQTAQELLSRGSSEAFDMEQRSVPKALLRAQVSELMGDQELKRMHYNSARALLEARIQEQPGDPQLHSNLGIALAGLGLKEDAVREGQLASELLPVGKEAWSGLFLVENLARIYVMVGEHDVAIDQIEYLLSIPGELSVPLLRLDPAWDPLRDHPRFKKLMETKK